VAAIPLVVAAAVLYTMMPQLEWAYYVRRPRDLEKPIQGLFAARLPAWYQSMSQSEQKTFRERVFLARLGTDVKGQGFEDGEVPVDVESLIVSQLVRVAAPSGRYVIEPFETVVVYQHPFPSPEFPEQWHSSELYAEDGVVLLSLEAALPGIFEPRNHFNIALYEWARAALSVNDRTSQTKENIDWQSAVQSIAGKAPEWVSDAIGLGEHEVDGSAVLEVLRLEFETYNAE